MAIPSTFIEIFPVGAKWLTGRQTSTPVTEPHCLHGKEKRKPSSKCNYISLKYESMSDYMWRCYLVFSITGSWSLMSVCCYCLAVLIEATDGLNVTQRALACRSWGCPSLNTVNVLLHELNLTARRSLTHRGTEKVIVPPLELHIEEPTIKCRI